MHLLIFNFTESSSKLEGLVTSETSCMQTKRICSFFIASIIVVVGDLQGGKKPVWGGGVVVGRGFFPHGPPS